LRSCEGAVLSRVRNVHRSIGTKVSGEIGYQRGAEGLPEGTLTLNLTVTRGQTFGAKS
jgi:glutamate synthase (NADPH/NADH) large chain